MGQFIKRVGGRAVGDIFMHAGTTPPARALACDAGRYSVTDYAKLFAVIQHRFAALGDDTEDGFFRVPGSETVQPFFRQAEKTTVPGFAFEPSPEYVNYTNMTGTEGVNYGYEYAEIAEGPDAWDYFRATRNGASSGAWSRYRWLDATQTAGKIYLPFVWQARFNSNCNTYHHIGLIDGTESASTALKYGVRIQAQRSGGTCVLSGVHAILPDGSTTSIAATVFPSGTPSYPGDIIELSVSLWFDLDGLEWGVQIGQISTTIGEMDAMPPAGLCPSYMINWTGAGDAEGRLYMIHNSALSLGYFGGVSPSAWDVAPIVAPSGFANLWDWPDSITWATGATGGAEFHDHGGATGGYGLTGTDLPALETDGADFEGATVPALTGVAYSATPGADHAHDITSVSALPPYIDVLYCIQYK